jgi:hypothetical protein
MSDMCSCGTSYLFLEKQKKVNFYYDLVKLFFFSIRAAIKKIENVIEIQIPFMGASIHT